MIKALLISLLVISSSRAYATPKVAIEFQGVRIVGLSNQSETYCFQGPICEGREVLSNQRGQCVQMGAGSMINMDGTCFQLGYGEIRQFTPKYVARAQAAFNKRARSAINTNRNQGSDYGDGVEYTNEQIQPYNPIFNFQKR